MLGVPGLLTGDGAPAVAESGGSSEVAEESERSGGNRWPRQETLALLKIRSDMDVAFRDASLKGPLWEEVSRKMGEAGFQRSAKKCKEKFENVYKYHKRTKDGRASKPDGKTYRFFDQLAALESTHFTPPPPPPPPPPRLQPPVPTTMAAPPLPTSHQFTVSSTSPTPLSVAPPKIVANQINSSFQQPPIQPPVAAPIPPPVLSTRTASNSTSSSTSSDEDIQRRRGKKRKWKDYFERLMKDVIQKQEELQKKFLDTLEKRERDRIDREEAWRVHEMARMNREHDRLVQERSAAAGKDTAIIAFLQKVTGEKQTPQIGSNHNNAPMQIQTPENPRPPSLPPTPQPQQSTLPPASNQAIVMSTPTKTMEISNGGEVDVISAGSSRWPKAEVEALIKLRTGLETKYQDNGPKGPLWEDISKSMAQLGYNRNAKRCKEKWENINKYFKKVKESNKKRPEDAKTCPYFHQLDAIYKEKAKSYGPPNQMLPIMARPEQQWPLPEQNPALDLHESENEEEEDEEEEEDQYEMIAKPSSLTNTME